jgi:transposase
MTKSIPTIGLDLAKNIFQIHRVDEHGNVVEKKRLKRKSLLNYFANLSPHLVGVESCCGSNYWSREIEKLGHTVRQMNPRFVKPYVKTNKSDARDAEAICEAVGRPSMRFVPIKTNERMDLQAIQRLRDRMISDRTALINQARSFLLESGITIPQGRCKVRSLLPSIWEDTDSRLSTVMRDILSDIYDRLVDIDQRIENYDAKIKKLVKNNSQCSQLIKIPGIGPLTALALFSAIGNGFDFKNGRHLSAWLGLVPRQNSSGHREQLLGISKRGNTHLRRLLVEGAFSLSRFCHKKTDRLNVWFQDVIKRRGKQKACLALANKLARIAWAVLNKGISYNSNYTIKEKSA